MTEKKLPKCEYCGREFMPRTAWQKFCSEAHRVAAWLKARKPAKTTKTH